MSSSNLGKIRCLVLRTVQSHQERKKEFFKKLYLAAHSRSFRKNGTVDVPYPNNDFLFSFFILGPNISDNFDCLGFLRFLSKLLRLLLKVTKVTTGHQKMPKIGQNSIISSFFAQRANKASAEGRSPPQEREVGPRSGLYLLV